MKFLFLRSHYYPEIAASLYLIENLIQDLAQIGHEIHVHTPTPSRGISRNTYNQYKDVKFEQLENGRIKIFRFSMFKESQNSFLRALRYLLIDLILLLRGLGSKDIDLIIVGSTPPLVGFVAGILGKIKKIPFIYIMQDIFPESLINTGITKHNSIIRKLGIVFERKTYDLAERIIVPSRDFQKNLIDNEVSSNKIKVIYNWVDESAVVNIPNEINDLFEEFQLTRTDFIISHCGNIGHTQNFDLLIEVAKYLEEFQDIKFVLIGDGAYKKNLLRKIEEQTINNIFVFPFQNYSEISKVFSLGDVGLVISKANISRNSIPSKTWSIMAAGKPVLASFDLDSELSSIINRAGCGVCVPANDKEAMKNAIINLYNNRPANYEMGKKGREFILSHFTRKIGTSIYMDVINEVFSKN